MSVVVY